jgi:CRISPR system Cascade subunit CasE
VIDMPLYLSRIVLDPRRHWTATILRNSQATHAFAMTPFIGTRAENQVLYHLDAPAHREPVLLIQSVSPPDWARANPSLGIRPTVKDITAFHDTLQTGQRLRFRLIAAPTRSSPDGFLRRERGTRLPIHDPQAQEAWFTRRIAPACDTDTLVVAPHAKRSGWKSTARDSADKDGTAAGSRTITHNQVAFSGVLTVRNPAELRTLAAAGIGTGKAYGCGLLALAHCTDRAENRPGRRESTLYARG